MKFLDLLNSLSLLAIAISLVWMAIQLQSLLGSTSKLTPALLRYFARIFEHDPHDPHHFYASKRSLVFWEWRGGQWVLREESGPLELAGPPPTRPGSYESECVTTGRPDIRR